MARLAPIAMGVAAAAGICASAAGQASIQYSLHWSDIGGAANGVLDPGETARIVLDVAFTPAVGATIAYTNPPPGGIGTVAGLGSAWLDVANTCGVAGGVWVLSGSGFGGTTGANWGLRTGWDVAGPIGAGTAQPGGTVRDIQPGQFPVPGQTANSLNPVIEVWRGKWSPSSFAVRVLTFTAQPAFNAQGTPSAYLIVRYGTGPGGEPFYTSVTVPTTASSVNIPIGMVMQPCSCYANCDGSSSAPTLNVNDFICFNNRFAAGQSYANCDSSTVPPVLNVNDFTCFLNRYAAGCP